MLGDFALRELVGAGGFGDVYLAEQQALRRDAIVKGVRGVFPGDVEDPENDTASLLAMFKPFD